MFSANVSIAPLWNFLKTEKDRNWKKEVNVHGAKRREKTLNHPASCLLQGRGWRHLLLSHSQTVETSAIFYTECTWGRSPVLHWIHSSAWGQPLYSVHYCVQLREEEKKEEGAKGGEGNLCLCAGKTQQESDLVIIWVCQHRRTFLPPSDSGATSSPEPSFAKRRSHIRAFSDRQTATPGLLLMMRADVRAGSMNIDVEDSLFHRRTERGKMAAL